LAASVSSDAALSAPIADSGGPAVEVSAEGRKNTPDAERFEGKVQQRKVSRLSWNVNAAF